MQMVLNDNFVLTYIDTLLGEKKTVSSTTLCAQNAISNKKIIQSLIVIEQLMKTSNYRLLTTPVK